jgi:hypothetical protein
MNECVEICGRNASGLDSDLVGCGKRIVLVEDLFRCADCKVPFHLECMRKHFGDGNVLTQEMIDEQFRRDKERRA